MDDYCRTVANVERGNKRKHCNAIAMIIASRSLKITASEISDVVINIHAPEPARVDRLCRYDMGWPEGKVERHGTGMHG